MRALILCGLLLAVTSCGGRAPTRWDAANSEAVKVLKAPENPYFIIYHPAVDLAKQPAR
jgi:hypothetical protein